MFPKSRNKFPGDQAKANGADYSLAIAIALKEEVGDSRRAVKTLVRWTGASDRTVQHWLSAEHGPSGPHLVKLARRCTSVHLAYLSMAGRANDSAERLNASIALIQQALSLLLGES